MGSAQSCLPRSLARAKAMISTTRLRAKSTYPPWAQPLHHGRVCQYVLRGPLGFSRAWYRLRAWSISSVPKKLLRRNGHWELFTVRGTTTRALPTHPLIYDTSCVMQKRANGTSATIATSPPLRPLESTRMEAVSCGLPTSLISTLLQS